MRGYDRTGSSAGGATRSRALLALVCLLLGLAAIAAASAPAQDVTTIDLPPAAQDPGGAASNPGPTCQDATGEELGCDTQATPVAKPSDRWSAVGGAVYGKDGKLVDGSQTPDTVDFYGVRFLSETEGYAVGAACEDDTPFAELDSCPRVPVIWHYSAAPGQPASWEEVYRGSSRGYVAAIAPLPDGELLAVGGDGHYPRRELARADGESDAAYAARDLAGDEPNASGRARVWTVDPSGSGDLSVREVDDSDLPELAGSQMSGLDTVDCSPRPADGGLCAAGGLRQIWMWRGGQFTKAYSGQSPPSDVEGVSGFRFRVRQIRFLSGATVPPIQVVAVTSGCCSGSVTTDSPRLLKFDGSRWYVRLLVANQPTNEPADGRQDAKPRETLPDSYYSLFVTPPDGINNRKLSVIASPGGPATDRELPSRLIGGLGMDGGSSFLLPNETDLANELGDPRLSPMRLNAGDGDFAGPGCGEAGGGCTFSGGGSGTVPGGAGGLDASLSGARGGPDGVMDWAVGELRPGGQGIAYTTVPGPTPVADATACPEQNPAAIAALIGLDPANAAKCQPTDAGTIEAGTQDKRLIGLPTYALNGFAFVPGSSIGWAVGDRGAIERLGGELGSGAHDPLPPGLPTGQAQTLPAAGAYDGMRPTPDSGEVGEVPGQASLPTRQLPHPEFVPTGSPDTSRSRAAPSEEVTKMVMSRDGGEGWAIGQGVDSGAGGTTLYHYDGGVWSRCDTEAIPDQVPPNPRCAALAPLRENSESGRPAPVGLGVAARVPLERDADPSNDDDFEVIAMGGQYQAPGTQGKKYVVTRYRDGRWSIDQQATDQLAAAGLSKPLDLAFTAPNDGWLVGDKSFGPSLFHYDGTKWVNCADDRAACGDSGSVLPISSSFATTGKNTGFLSVAGDRVYFAGTRLAGNETLTGFSTGRTPYPVILYKDPGGSWTADNGGYDPGCAQRTGSTCEGSSDPTQQGCVTAISVGTDPEGGFAGWAAGMFGGSSNANCPDTSSTTYSLLRLGSSQWQPWTADDASKDYLWPLTSSMLLTLPHPDHGPQALLLPRSNFENNPSGPMLGFSGQHWEATGTPFSLVDKPGSFVNQGAEATPRALAPDGQGGFWIAVRRNGNLSTVGPDGRSTRLGTFFYHYTDRAPERVFRDVPHPIREQITAAAGGADGSFWVATASKAVYRYDRVTGWEKVGIPGWDPGRVVTRPSEANAIAVGPDGSGVVVGRKGRIADLTPTGIALDPASSASTVCNVGGAGGCGTGFDLQAAAAGPDGSAMVGGDRMALLYRPPGDAFRAIARPPAAPDAQITGIAMPSGGSAWLTTDTGQVWAGTGNGSDWSWRLESLDSQDHLLTLDSGGDPIPLRAVAIDSSGHGYAVGDQGIVLERTGGGDLPWKRLETGFRYDLDSVALPATGQGSGALIGGLDGLVVTRSDGRFVVARTPDPWDPVNTGQSSQTSARIVGMALLPGTEPGQLEAWAASQVPDSQQRTPAPGAILHYTNSPDNPLLDGGVGRSRQLPDTPPPDSQAVSIAAFGRSDCRLPTDQCPEPQDSNLGNERIARGIADRLIDPPAGEAPIDLALFTGDVNQTAGRNTARGDNLARPDTPLDTDTIHHRWVELYAERLWGAGIPFYGALGPQDLSQAQSCYAQCATTHKLGSEAIPGAGTSGPWRESLSAAPAPWGDGAAPAEHHGITVAPLSNSGTAAAPDGGAATHYAADLERDGQKLVRLVVLDNSLGSLQASDANSNPLEAGGQLAWLRDVLTSRPAGERAIVALNTPTYSYGPGSLTETSSDATQLETVLFQGNVDAVITGRLGWNALYWATSPALHSPAPGSGYPDPNSPPSPQGGFARSIPFLIASGAGGTFNSSAEQQGQTSAANGFWHGYSILRLDTSSGQVAIEQRPILDWVGITPRRGATHVVRAGKKLELFGYGREAGGTDVPFRYDEISTPAITHRFDLLYADPEHPWLPATDDSPPSGIAADGPESCGPYVCMDAKTGTIDRQSGQVRSGNGNYPRTFALAELSVGDQSATYPLVFEPRASYRPPRPAVAPPVAVPAPPPAAAPPPAQTPTASAPPAPVLPVLATQTPPPPPAPPAPPTFASQAPMDLSISPTSINVLPPTAVSQPPTPPVNPAPPSGARREARQRQAAAQKSGADSDQESSEAQDLGGDSAQGPDQAHGAAATRHEHSFTAISDHRQPSAWTRDLLLGGGLGGAALILALGLGTARPKPRRREPEVPAPAWARHRRRG